MGTADMQLKSISIEGFMGVPSGEQNRLELADMRKHNILVGPNNAGKSLVTRLFTLMKQWVFDDNELGVYSNRDIANLFLFWDHGAKHEIKAEFAFSIPGDVHVPGHVHVQPVPDQAMRFAFRCSIGDSNRASGILMPRVRIREEWRDAFTNSGAEYLGDDGAYRAGHIAEAMRQFFSAQLARFSNSIYFFDAVRAIDLNRDGKTFDDGSRLLGELHTLSLDQQHTVRWDELAIDLRDSVNNVVASCGVPPVDRIVMKSGSDRPAMLLYFKPKPRIPIDLRMMGGGIAQLVIILAAAIRGRDEDRIVVAEELETHLHPALLRSFIEELRKFHRHQLIATTHSPVLIQQARENDRVYRFWQDPKTLACLVERCDEAVASHSALDSLGVRGSDLLQTNCAIWVEGPSDRLYVRRWLDQVAKGLIEGRDYAFVFYGGAILSHHSLDLDGDASVDEMAGDFLRMLYVCRYSAVLVDRDVPPEGTLAPRKRRVMEEADKDHIHRVFAVTEGREIENDLPRAALIRGAAALLSRDASELQKVSFTSELPYERCIADAITTDQDLKRRLADRLGSKVELARRVIEEWPTTDVSAPSYIDQFVKLIERSRGSDAR